MISAPLGDFRHTMHIGRAGDAFGDTSFLAKVDDQQEPEESKKEFGDLTDLPDTAPKSTYGMKHAESIMSFHIDLGPSMLGDILSIMDKDQWEQDLDLGLDKLDGNGANRRQHSMPSKPTGPSAVIPSTKAAHGSLPTSSRNNKIQPTKENHSVSRGSSGIPEEKPRKGRDFSFMDEEEEDEIRV
ncbi:unnamed protein product [Staurois parvus]|uniref:CRIB domain-containing protein n=1 Tax=Staurois parvus TaxID=386267 RepID=A0ABN9F1F2_9NEOB|nr:unnamed protein product [Staurois parvus]